MCKVSVIMPLFNANKYIYKTIHSILNQTYPDFELIIIDDKSLDNSVDIVNSIKDKRIKLYMNEKNMGIAYTRNRALDLCNGEYIAIMDDDDIAPDYRFKDEVEFLNGNKEIDIVAGNTCFIDENDKVTGMGERVIRNPELIKAYLMLGNVFGNSTAMVRKNFIRKYNIHYKNNMYGAEDYRFWAECSVYGKISALDKVMLYWRKHNNESDKIKNNFIKERKKTISDIQKYLLKHYGFYFTEQQEDFLLWIFAEDGQLESKKDIEDLYKIFKEIIYQAEKLKLDNYNEIVMMCRKKFGKKCGTAFFLWA